MSFRKLFSRYKRKHQNCDADEAKSSGPNDDEWVELAEEADPPGEGRVLKPQISESEFACACCFELMVDPTTLTCGHNFCRLCVARWSHQSKKRECPECRQQWSGHPRVNITLRSTIERLYGDRYRERKAAQEADPDSRSALQWFEQLNAPVAPVRLPQTRWVIKGVIGAGVAYLAWCALQFLFGSRGELEASRPVMRWSAHEVELWLQRLGPWTQDKLVPAFQANYIDGQLLMVMTDEELDEVLQEVAPLHQRAFRAALYSLRELGTRPPVDLWEYKTLHLGRAMFLLYALRPAPRLTMLYLMLFERADCFLPLIHVTGPALGDLDLQNVSIYNFKFPEPALGQWVDLLVKWLFFPYLLIMQFTWRTGQPWFPSLAILISCAIATANEASLVVKIYNGVHVRDVVRAQLREAYTTCRNLLIGVVLWPFVPSFICHLLFWVTLYCMPYNDGVALRARVGRR